MKNAEILKKDISQRTLVISCFLLTCIKLWLVRAHLLMVTVTPHDDLHFIQGAASILQGNWLGDYNQLTLIKEPFYPIFIAVCHWLTIPLLLGQQIFYAFSCCVFIWAVRPLRYKRYLLLAAYVILLLNPGSYNYPAVGRVFQLAIYAPLATILLSTLLGMAIRTPISFKRALLWSVLLGISMGIFWITRDESIFILPSVLLIFLFLLVSTGRKNKLRLAQVVLLCALPLLISQGIVDLIKEMNGHKYGVPYTVEIKSDEFRSAYGGLLRIKSDKERQYFPVVRDVREKAYAVSPTFQKVEKYLEGPVGHAWMSLAGDNDIPAAFFIWALRDSVAKAGFATSGPVALAFYKKMGQEIHDACNSGKLKCRGQFSSLIPSTALVPTWHKEYTKLILPTFVSIIERTTAFEHFNASTEGARSRGPEEVISFFNAVTGERVLDSKKHNINDYEKLNAHLDKEKTRILGQIGWVYQIICPYAFAFSLILLAWRLFVALRKRNLPFMTVFSLSTLGGIFGITFVMTLLTITSYSEIDRVMHVSFPIVLLFIISVFLDMTGTEKATADSGTD